MAHCYRPKKDVKGMRQFLVKLVSGKQARATISYKEKLETVKEIDANLASIEKRLKLNDESLQKQKITAISYENTKATSKREQTRLEERRKVIADLTYVGESVEFLRYLPATT